MIAVSDCSAVYGLRCDLLSGISALVLLANSIYLGPVLCSALLEPGGNQLT